MAAISRKAPTGTPDQIPASIPPAQSYGHDFSLQAIMEMQKSIGQMQSSIEGLRQTICSSNEALAKSIDSVKATANDTRDKVLKFERYLTAAIAVSALVLCVGGWMLNTAKDMALMYMRANAEVIAKPTAGQPQTKR